jgi:hypothetical protein
MNPDQESAMVEIPQNRFELGQVVGTPAALEAIRESGQRVWDFLVRHLAGDWGNLCAEDKRLNDAAVLDGGRLLSAYTTARGVRVWVLTEAADDRGRRAATCLLLPEEY